MDCLCCRPESRLAVSWRLTSATAYGTSSARDCVRGVDARCSCERSRKFAVARCSFLDAHRRLSSLCRDEKYTSANSRLILAFARRSRSPFALDDAGECASCNSHFAEHQALEILWVPSEVGPVIRSGRDQPIGGSYLNFWEIPWTRNHVSRFTRSAETDSSVGRFRAGPERRAAPSRTHRPAHLSAQRLRVLHRPVAALAKQGWPPSAQMARTWLRCRPTGSSTSASPVQTASSFVGGTPT